MGTPPTGPVTSASKPGVPWFWAALLILAAVAGVGYVVVAPVLEHEASHRIPFNEQTARVALRTIVTAEELWRSQDHDGNGKPDYWTADWCGLYRPGIPKDHRDPTIDENRSHADRFPDRSTDRPTHLPGSPVPLRGYYFEALLNDENGKPYATEADKDGKPRLNANRFGFRATPEVYGKTGRLTFQVNQEGTTYSKDLGHGAEANPPRASWEGGENPTRSGWKAVD